MTVSGIYIFLSIFICIQRENEKPISQKFPTHTHTHETSKIQLVIYYNVITTISDGFVIK